MSAVVLGFWASLVVTLVALAVTVWAGLTARRRSHVVGAVTSVLLLALAVVFARLMATERDFPREQMRIHLRFAISATFAVAPVVITGVGLLWRPRWRWAHRIAVGLFLLLAVSAIGTGIWVFTLSTPK